MENIPYTKDPRYARVYYHILTKSYYRLLENKKYHDEIVRIADNMNCCDCNSLIVNPNITHDYTGEPGSKEYSYGTILCWYEKEFNPEEPKDDIISRAKKNAEKQVIKYQNTHEVI